MSRMTAEELQEIRDDAVYNGTPGLDDDVVRLCDEVRASWADVQRLTRELEVARGALEAIWEYGAPDYYSAGEARSALDCIADLAEKALNARAALGKETGDG